MKKILILILLVFLCHTAIGQKKELHSIIDFYAKEHRFNGTILVEKDSTLVYQKIFVIYDRKKDNPIKKKTVYKFAYITKAIKTDKTNTIGFNSVR